MDNSECIDDYVLPMLRELVNGVRARDTLIRSISTTKESFGQSIVVEFWTTDEAMTRAQDAPIVYPSHDEIQRRGWHLDHGQD